MGARPSHFTFTTPGAMRLYSTTELLALPPPDWIIDNILTDAGLAVLYAPPESYKSFVAIDLALCVATGTPWHGHSVRRGFVLYIGAEGGPGLGKRARAWLQAHGIAPTAANIGWLIEAVQVWDGSDDIDTLEGRLDVELEKTPALIIIDTLARCFDGDENQQEDMGRFVAGMDRLRHKYGCTILAIHHTRLDGDRERGNTALRGGLDTMIQVTRQDTQITISCAKQKDAEHFPDFDLQFQVVPGTDSGIIDADRALADKTARIASLLELLAVHKGLTWDDWLVSSTLSKTSFQRYVVELKKSGQILKENGVYRLA